MKYTQLTKDNASVGLKIFNRKNPEWGTFTLDQDRNGWIRSRTPNRSCDSAILNEDEFHFWEIMEDANGCI